MAGGRWCAACSRVLHDGAAIERRGAARETGTRDDDDDEDEDGCCSEIGVYGYVCWRWQGRHHVREGGDRHAQTCGATGTKIWPCHAGCVDVDDDDAVRTRSAGREYLAIYSQNRRAVLSVRFCLRSRVDLFRRALLVVAKYDDALPSQPSSETCEGAYTRALQARKTGAESLRVQLRSK